MKHYYVKINKLDRKTLIDNAEWFEQCSFDTVEYNEGGWLDMEYNNVHPHLMFHSKQDALQFIIAKGGEYSETVPLDI